MAIFNRNNLLRTASYLAVLLFVFFGCSDEGAGPKKDSGTQGVTDGKGTSDGKDDDGNDDDGTTTSSGGTTDEGGTDDGTTDGSTFQISGEKMFSLAVEPLFQKDCVTCHADPRFVVENRGPLTIFNYRNMKPWLEGGSSVDNALLRKMLGINHTGGNRCPGGVETPPCSTVTSWFKAEYGDDGAKPVFIEDPSSVDPRPAAIGLVSALGKVFGWAVNKGDLTETLTVTVYANGDKDSGTLIGTATADKEGPDGNHEGNHQFILQLPAAQSDGTERGLYVYATIDGVETLVVEDSKYTSYSYSAAGRQYFEDNIAAGLAQCQSCHGVGYEAQFSVLISPTPADGGTATDNELINKAGTRNGTGHGGGNRCGGGGVCTNFEEWWRIEFGP